MRKEIAQFLQTGQEAIARFGWSMLYDNRIHGLLMRYWSSSVNFFLHVSPLLKPRESVQQNCKRLYQA